MDIRMIRKPMVAGLVVLALLVAFGWVVQTKTPDKAENILSLKAPPFVGVASAAEAASDASFLEQEAGIAAYTEAERSIDLSLVRDVFRAIERETAEYIVGSVGIADYSENFDPHVFVHTDGWVVAYYLAADPSSMVIDMRHYDGGSMNSMLEDAMEQILSPVGMGTFEATYYDFRHPNATALILIVELMAGIGEDSFEVKLPGEFTYYERAWGHLHYEGPDGSYSWESSTSTLYIDLYSIDTITQPSGSGWAYAYGIVNPSHLLPDAFHTVKLHVEPAEDSDHAVVGIALVYQEVP